MPARKENRAEVPSHTLSQTGPAVSGYASEALHCCFTKSFISKNKKYFLAKQLLRKIGVHRISKFSFLIIDNFIPQPSCIAPVVLLVLAVAFSPQPAAAALESARLGTPLRCICAMEALTVVWRGLLSRGDNDRAGSVGWRLWEQTALIESMADDHTTVRTLQNPEWRCVPGQRAALARSELASSQAQDVDDS